MPEEVSIADAKNNLTKLVYQAELGEAVRITRRGKPVAVLISEAEYGHLAPRTKKDPWRAVEDWRRAASFDWHELGAEEVDSWRDRSSGSESPGPQPETL